MISIGSTSPSSLANGGNQVAVTPPVMIVVLNWNRLADTVACLESLSCLDYPARQIVVVDNGSDDGSVEAIRERFPAVALIENEENLGYAAGNNKGVAYALQAGVNFILILNNDTLVDPEMLAHLIAVAEANPQVGAVGPKIYYHAQPGRIWFAGGAINWQGMFTANVGMDEEDRGQFEEVKPVDFLPGCALLIKRAAWEDIGPFDSRFFMYWEETDWCARARQAGYDLLFVPQARMWHKVSPVDQSESPRILYYMTRNRFLFLHKNLPFPRKVIVLIRCSWGVFRTVIGFLRRGKREQAKAVVRGGADFLRGRFGHVPTASEVCSK